MLPLRLARLPANPDPAFRIVGTLDSATTSVLARPLMALVSGEERPTVVRLDFVECEYISSAGWGALLQLTQAFKASGVSLDLERVHFQFRAMAELIGISDRLHFA